jgi:hypothetical protein
LLKAVKIHCGSAHVHGKAKQYPYVVASLFYSRLTKKGKMIWYNTGKNTAPRRSLKLCKADAEEFARSQLAMFIDGYGSLHNTEVTHD